MSNFSKIVILILILLSFLFIKERYGDSIVLIYEKIKNPNIDEVVVPEKFPDDTSKPEKENDLTLKNDKEYSVVYFLALDSNDNGIYKKVQRELPDGQEKLIYSLQELLKGPNLIEKAKGIYSEIPTSTKLLDVKTSGNKTIIDLSSDFQYGGGTDSIYSRMMQLIKTSIQNSESKNIYLYLDGKKVDTIGGEGIMITQPLNEKSLEI